MQFLKGLTRWFHFNREPDPCKHDRLTKTEFADRAALIAGGLGLQSVCDLVNNA